MKAPDVLVLDENSISATLRGMEDKILARIRTTYEMYGTGACVVPKSAFMRLSEARPERFIALPAAIPEAAGVKWIASYPSNIDQGLNRASAVIVLNSNTTGYPVAIMEGALISAVRTAASAVVAAQALHPMDECKSIGLIGAGRINFEVARMRARLHPLLDEVVVYDYAPRNFDRFEAAMGTVCSGIRVLPSRSVDELLDRTSLISIATSAVEPHIHSLSELGPGATVLHLSLRDLAPELLLGTQNIVDDVEHVLSNGTSLAAAAKLISTKQGVIDTITDILTGRCTRDPARIAVFSPFGLGVLDIALASMIEERARTQALGVIFPSLSPEPWYA